jgi:predicted glycoside hydrolase/deacetylase ChbG (UPF0249 family)
MSTPKLRRIWLCADDYGMAPGINTAICDLVALRRINATSVMVVAPSFTKEAARDLIEAAGKHAAIGLHFTLTAPFRPLSHNFEPLHQGAFVSLAAMLRRSHLRSLKPELLTLEAVRQFEAFAAAFGRPPDFVDGHQHVQLLPQIAEAVLRVIKDAAPEAWIRQCGRTIAAHRRFADRKALLLDGLSRPFRRLAARHNVPTNPGFAGAYAFSGRSDYATLFSRFLDGLRNGGVVMCHPGTLDAELRRLDPLTDLREHEYRFFREPEFLAVLRRHDVALA